MLLHGTASTATARTVIEPMWISTPMTVATTDRRPIRSAAERLPSVIGGVVPLDVGPVDVLTGGPPAPTSSRSAVATAGTATVLRATRSNANSAV